jgi:hypothetical protein
MNLARKGTFREWRAALPLALCFQQLLRGVECFDLDGSNSSRHADFFRVPVDDSRPNCVGVFMSDYIDTGSRKSFFVCKLAQTGKLLQVVPTERVATATMRNACKLLILASGLKPSFYATHSSKRGGALEAGSFRRSNPRVGPLV